MSSPTQDDLLLELYERSAIVLELDGPQIAAWVSGLFAVLDGDVTPAAFVGFCVSRPSKQSSLVCQAIEYLTEGLDLATHAAAADAAERIGREETTIGGSELHGAWQVLAPFGRSIVLGFNPATIATQSETAAAEDSNEEVDDGRHAILVELDEAGTIADLQLSGPADLLVEDAAVSDERVTVEALAVDDALAQVVEAWPQGAKQTVDYGPGVAANQQFVRQRLRRLCGKDLPHLELEAQVIDVRRGLDDADYAQANAAALATLRSAVAFDATVDNDTEAVALVASIVRGDVDGVSSRERDGLLWLEWADWLGACIGLIRAGEMTSVSGLGLVDHVNRCPEVSSTIDKNDREYAAWAFDVACELLADAGLIEDAMLTAAGHAALVPGLQRAWMTDS